MHFEVFHFLSDSTRLLYANTGTLTISYCFEAQSASLSDSRRVVIRTARGYLRKHSHNFVILKPSPASRRLVILQSLQRSQFECWIAMTAILVQRSAARQGRSNRRADSIQHIQHSCRSVKQATCFCFGSL